MSTPDTSAGMTRDELYAYRLSVVSACARILADHEPTAAYEVSLCKEAERYMTKDPDLREVHTALMIATRQELFEARGQVKVDADDLRHLVAAALAKQHDMVADKLEATVGRAKAILHGDTFTQNEKALFTLLIEFGDVACAALLLISAELHDDG